MTETEHLMQSLAAQRDEAIRDSKDHYAEVKRLRNELTARTLERDRLQRDAMKLARAMEDCADKLRAIAAAAPMLVFELAD